MSQRRSSVIEGQLARRLATNCRVFCFALGGEMASDAYLISKHLLVGERAPRAIIYGIAPRDLHDNLVPAIYLTSTWDTLATLSDSLEQLGGQPFEKAADIVLKRTWALWRYKRDIVTYANWRSKKLLERLLPWVCFERYDANGQLRPHRFGLLPDEARGEPVAIPGLAIDHYPEQKTIEDYIRRYNPLDKEFFSREMSYLDRLADTAGERRIRLILVNMPLSRKNQSLFPAGFYPRYMQSLWSLKKRKGVELIDMNTSNWSKDDNFIDTVHLKPEVSGQFLQELADTLAKNQALILAFKARSLAQKHPGG